MISSYIVWFAAFGLGGWLFECVYGAIVTHHWENRGFLFGPICPIYGVGAVAALAAVDLIGPGVQLIPLWQVFVVSMLGSAVLEYSVSYAFERLFGAVWWDYSNLPLNLNGRICLPASVLFGIAGVVIVAVVAPFTHWVDAHIPPLAMEAAALGIVAVIAADTALTISTLSDLMEKIDTFEGSVNRRMETLVSTAYEKGQSLPQMLPSVDQVSAALLKDTAENLTRRQRALMRKMRRVTSKKKEAALTRLKEARRAFEAATANRKER